MWEDHVHASRDTIRARMVIDQATRTIIVCDVSVTPLIFYLPSACPTPLSLFWLTVNIVGQVQCRCGMLESG